jgi:hypothetical protein
MYINLKIGILAVLDSKSNRELQGKRCKTTLQRNKYVPKLVSVFKIKIYLGKTPQLYTKPEL